MLCLARPSILYKDSYIEALKEFHKEGRNLKYTLENLTNDFDTFVQEQLSGEDETTLKPGLVKESYFWMVDNDEFIGRVSVRHELNDFLLKFSGHIGYNIRPDKRKQGYGRKILELALEEAKKLNLQKVLLTCDSENTGSKKIIEANGGIFENEILSEGKTTLRYWINL